MMLQKLVLLAVVFIVHGQYKKRCNDCVAFSECPGAVYLAVNQKTSRTESIVKGSVCSTEKVDELPKVCCSEFPPSPSEIDSHPNLSLLPNDCGEIKGRKIIGGDVAELYEFPWMVLISYKTRNGKEFLCGGSLINSLYVLTAAHCVKNQNILGVRLGEYDWNSPVDCDGATCESNLQDVAVTEKIIHPSYNGAPLVRNDIALLRLGKPAKLEFKNIGTVCLPITKELRERSLGNVNATVTGWGLTENRTTSSKLLKVLVPIHTAENCELYFNRGPTKDTTKNILCAGSLGKDSCKGDSGGPLMLEVKNNDKATFVQYGIVSHGPIQCGSMFPGIYTDVSWFMKWILDTIKQ